MKKGKNRVNFSEETGITREAMTAYIEGTLPAEQVALFDKLLEQDEFAREALEGWQQANTITATETLKQLNETVKRRTGLEETKVVNIHYGRWLMAAASVVAFAGIGFLLVQWWGVQQKPVAMQEQTKGEEKVLGSDIPPANRDADIAQVPSDTAAYTVTEIQDLPDMAGSVSEQKDKVPIANAKTDANKTNRSLTLSGAVEEQSARAVATAPAATIPVNNNRDETAAGRMASADPAADKKTESAPAAAIQSMQEVTGAAYEAAEPASADDALPPEKLMVRAREDFDKGEYTKASKSYSKILNKDPENVDALYFGGISDYVSGNYKRAEKNFDKLLKQGGRYTDGSRWYKANILLKAGKKEAATELYRELTNSSGSFKERAIKKLEELGY